MDAERAGRYAPRDRHGRGCHHDGLPRRAAFTGGWPGMKSYVIGLDQGTSGSLACLMNRDGEVVRSAYQAHPPAYPQPGWVEQDPNELWRVACNLLNRVMAEAGINADEIAGIGLDNQGESIVLWDRRTGEALSHVLV